MKTNEAYKALQHGGKKTKSQTRSRRWPKPMTARLEGMMARGRSRTARVKIRRKKSPPPKKPRTSRRCDEPEHRKEIQAQGTEKEKLEAPRERRKNYRSGARRFERTLRALRQAAPRTAEHWPERSNAKGNCRVAACASCSIPSGTAHRNHRRQFPMRKLAESLIRAPSEQIPIANSAGGFREQHLGSLRP